MKTVSTLCATSTVGIAACGFALGRPRELPLPEENRAAVNISPLPSSSPPSSNGRDTASPAFSTGAPSTATSKKAWYRRFSESLSSVTNSSHSASPTIASATSSLYSRIRNLPLSVETPTSRSPTRNKLVKRSNSRSVPANLHVTSAPLSLSPFKRPSTALPGRASLLLPGRSPSRPSTSLIAAQFRHRHLYLRSYDPKSVSSWRKFFASKRHNSKFDSIKRVYPNCFNQPTLVLGSSISHDQSDIDSSCSVQSIFYNETTPATPMDSSHCSESNLPTSPLTAENVRRSFSLSNFLSSAAPRLPNRNGKRHSSPSAPLSSYYTPNEITSAPLPYEGHAESREFHHLPPIDSLSVLNMDTMSDRLSMASDNEISALDVSSQSGETSSELEELTSHNRLSILSGGGSERASTLIGSEVDDQELALREPSDTVFDSVRTRVNDGVTPVRVESLFNYNPSPPASPLVIKQNNPISYSAEIDIDRISPTRSDFRGLTPPPARLEGWTIEKRDSNRTSWGSDWDLPENSKADENRSFNESPILRSRGSQLSHVKAYSQNDNSPRSSVEDWNDTTGHDENSPVNPSGSPVSSRHLPTSWRPRTAQIKVTQGLPGPLSNFAGSAPLHTRSQSLPARTDLSKTAVSENWDDDFADDGFGGLGCGVVVPKAIQEHQKKVLRHLDSVKEFAALVEELKRLREIAISSGSRWGISKWLWDEADGIIALASTGAVDDDISLTRGGPRHKLSKISSLSNEFSDEEGCLLLKERIQKRTSVLLPDDDIFGGGHSIEKTASSLKPRSLNKTASTPSSPSRSRRTSFNERSDPIAIARSMMEEMQRDRLSLSTSPTSTKMKEGGLHFDTRMLGPLLEKVKGLLENLKVSLHEAGSEFSSGPYSRVSVDGMVQVKDSFEFGGIDCRTAEVGVI